MKTDPRWAWIDRVSQESEIDYQNVLVSYRLNNPVCEQGRCKQNCKNNPLCLNGLGEQKWFEEFDDSDGEPPASVAKVGYSGLKNYGGTCYLNALLQVYYRFYELRASIYELPLEVDDGDIIRHLQVIFSQLQLSQTGTVDPGGLIEALHLCQAEQQDAPEFHSLFFNLLESRFMLIDNPIIETLFKGRCVYETKCLTCGRVSLRKSSFLELDLKILSAANSLYACIEDFLKVESLTGDNQYACPGCGCKRDGERRLLLSHLPPVLGIQMMRFSYDLKAGRKRKNKTVVRIPEMLKMGEFLSSGVEGADAPGSSTETNYILYGVLLHIGNEPTSGHYIAVVRDSPPNHLDWIVCNDSTVYSIPASEFNLSKVTGVPPSNAAKERQQQTVPEYGTTDPSQTAGPGTSTDAGNNGARAGWNPAANTLHVSSNAYMVFYEREDRFLDRSIGGSCEVTVPNHLLEAANACNCAYRMEQEQKLCDKAAAKLTHLAEQEQMRTLIGQLRARADEPETDLVPTEWLCDWLTNGGPERVPPLHWPQTQNRGGKQGQSQQQGGTAVPFFCPHGNLNVDLHPAQFRMVSSGGLSGLLEHCPENAAGVRRATQQSLCWRCIQWKYAATKFEQSATKLARDIEQVFKVNAFDERNEMEQEPWFWVGKGSLRRWRKLARDELQQRYAAKRSTAEGSASCAAAPLPDASNQDEDALVYAAAGNGDYGNVGQDGEEEEGGQEPGFNRDLLCPHGQLTRDPQRRRAIPAVLWAQLSSHFADCPVFPVVHPEPEIVCHLCSASQTGYQHRAQLERKVLVDLFNNRQRPRCLPSDLVTTSVAMVDSDWETMETDCGGQDQASSSGTQQPANATRKNAGPTPTKPDELYLVPNDFLNEWRRFMRQPSRDTLPVSIDMTCLLCSHQRLRGPLDELMSEFSLVPLYTEEWRELLTNYPVTGPTIRVVLTHPPTGWSVAESLEMCAECHALTVAERSQFTNAQIAIRLVTKDDIELGPPPAKRERYEALDSEVASTTESGSVSAANDMGVRRSCRQRRQRHDLLVRISSWLPLRDLKVELMNRLGVTPVEQHLFLGGRELSSMNQSVLDLGVQRDSVLLLYTDSPIHPDLLGTSGMGLVGEVAAATAASSRANIDGGTGGQASAATELGFKGTKLMGS